MILSCAKSCGAYNATFGARYTQKYVFLGYTYRDSTRTVLRRVMPHLRPDQGVFAQTWELFWPRSRCSRASIYAHCMFAMCMDVCTSMYWVYAETYICDMYCLLMHCARCLGWAVYKPQWQGICCVFSQLPWMIWDLFIDAWNTFMHGNRCMNKFMPWIYSWIFPHKDLWINPLTKLASRLTPICIALVANLCHRWTADFDTYIHANTHIHIHTQLTFVCMYILHAYTHTFMRIYIYTYIHTYRYTNRFMPWTEHESLSLSQGRA